MSYINRNIPKWMAVVAVMVMLGGLFPEKSVAQLLNCPCSRFYIRVGDIPCPITVCTVDGPAGGIMCVTYQPNTLNAIECSPNLSIGLRDACDRITWFSPFATPCINHFSAALFCCVNACLIIDPRTGCEMLDIQPSPALSCGCNG